MLLKSIKFENERTNIDDVDGSLTKNLLPSTGCEMISHSISNSSRASLTVTRLHDHFSTISLSEKSGRKGVKLNFGF